jgi:hypothetical protein
MPLVLPPAGTADPLTVEPLVVVIAEPPVVADDVAGDDDEVDGSNGVDTPRGSDPGSVLVVVVWACAIVEPRMMIAVSIVRCIRVLLLRDNCRPRRLPAMQDNARSVKNENEVYERSAVETVPNGRHVSGDFPGHRGLSDFAATGNGKPCARIRRRPARRSNRRNPRGSRR